MHHLYLGKYPLTSEAGAARCLPPKQTLPVNRAKYCFRLEKCIETLIAVRLTWGIKTDTIITVVAQPLWHFTVR